ncbi:N,N-dimethylformamidase beta subunit family domain-containing protein [Mesorhizobium dulcispinae]|uniref:N,N-dimethylformamidase beta subunit family domain-containing protein n=1 Tax=Mesorhizobium dulcispinae TaxID=3072316 RepID=UPI002A23B681|nr:N,N-dimethylformamidase beta subunit family domain-containing protein [Mesorhizobium sp. VK23D]
MPYFTGYMTAISVSQGEALSAHVATRSNEDCFVDIYRVTGCEDAHLFPKLSFVRRFGRIQPHRLPPSAGGRRLSSGDADSEGCRWPKIDLLEEVPIDWPSGVYLAQFCSAAEPRARASDRAGEDALFIVRSGADRPESRILCQVNVATWAAYHIWHNRSLYVGRTGDGQRFDDLRGSKASFHRPGIGLCYPNEAILSPMPPKAAYIFAFIDWLERERISVDFCSGLDISAGGANLANYDALVTIGHDEYWTADQLDAVRDFRNSGGHMIFFGGNLAFELVRETSDGSAIECYKESGDSYSGDSHDDERGEGGELLDPLLTASATLDARLTGPTWRVRHESTTPTTGVYNITRRPGAPGEVLIGGAMWWWEMFGGPSRPQCGFTICDPDHWVFEGLEINQGDTFGAETKLIGHEADGLEVEIRDARPQLTFADGALPGTRLLAVADGRKWGEWDFTAWPPTFSPGQQQTLGTYGGYVTMVYHEEPGKGMLFSAPTTDWVFGLVPSIDWTATRSLEPPLLPTDPVVEQVTRNVLHACHKRGERK